MATKEQRSRHPGESQDPVVNINHEALSVFSLPKILALILIPVLLFFTYVAGSWGLADIYARPAILKLNKWKQGVVKIAPAEWKELNAKLSRAAELDGTNPEIHEWLGLAIEGPYIGGSVDWNKASAARQLAAAQYRESIRLQPTWPYAWADLATVKFRLREFDGELLNAMHKSIELGPWEPGIQRVVADIGMSIWFRLKDPDREFILDLIRRSFMHVNSGHVRNMEALIKKHGFTDKVCQKPDSNEKLREFCKKNQ